MPHVVVSFNSKLFTQLDITCLKRALPDIVSLALSSNVVYAAGSPTICKVDAKDVLVTQHAWHESDINIDPIVVLILAGNSKGRDPEKVLAIIVQKINDFPAIHPVDLRASSVWLHFSAENAFHRFS